MALIELLFGFHPQLPGRGMSVAGTHFLVNALYLVNKV